MLHAKYLAILPAIALMVAGCSRTSTSSSPVFPPIVQESPVQSSAVAAAAPAPVVPIPATPRPITETATAGWEDLDSVVEKGIDARVYPGAVLIVGQPGKVIWAKAYGTTTYEADAPAMTLESMFDLASISKVVGTTSGALLAIEDGKVNLDDPVSKYIPGFEANGKDVVTIRQLMTHTSGLKAYESAEKVEKSRTDGEEKADALIRTYAALETSYQPGTSYVYSCLNFQSLARVVENATGSRLEDLVKARVYEPLGMTNTVYTLTPEQLERAVPTLKRPDGTLLVGRVHDPLASYHGAGFHCPGNAGVFGPATDLARYCEMFLNDGKAPDGRQVFSPEIVAEATRVQSPAAVQSKRGLGWDVYTSKPYVTPANQSDETLVLGHTGYTGTLMLIDKKSRTYTIFLTNRVYPNDETKPEGALNISRVRRDVADTVMRHLPEYSQYFTAAAAATDGNDSSTTN